MNFLPAVLCYIAVCLGLFILYICWHPLLCGPVWCLLEQCFQYLRLFVPLRLRIVCGGVIRWCFYEKHCFFQIVYVLLVFIAHVVLVRDVLPLLYTYAWMENHILVGLMCLFANVVMYLAVCLKDPGVVTSSRIAFYSSIHEYDNVIYKPVVCSECAFVRPPRTKHCYRCDHCVHRFDHHCVWTNSCIGSGNHVTFLGYLLSLLAMVCNASYLCVRALRLHVQATELWKARYFDEVGHQHPMSLSALIQHLLLTHPMIVCCCSTLLVLNLLLLGYFLFHVFLIVTNQTTYERYCQGEYNAGEPSSRTFYNLGVRRNIEEFLSGCYLPPRGTSSQYKLSPRIFNEKHA